MRLVSGLAGVGSILAVGVAFHGSVRASGFQIREESVVGAGSAFAGAGSAANTPSTVFDNPAGMTQLPGLQMQLGGSYIVPSFVFHGTSTNAFGRPNTGVDNRDGGNALFVPHAFITYKLTDQLALGLGLSAPFGLVTDYGNNFIGRYHAAETSLSTYNINPSIAYQVTPWLSLGAGISAQYADAEFTNFLNTSTIGTAALGRPVSLPDGYFHLRGNSWSWGYNFGALIQPAPQTNIGLAYRSRVQHDLSGSAQFLVPPPLGLDPRFQNSGGKAKLVLPDTATISVTQGFGPQWTVSAELSWTNWSQFKMLNVYRDNGALISSTPQHYKNTFFVALGANYQVNENLVLRAGTAFDKTPVSDAYRTARVPDQDRVWLSVGASYQLLPNTWIDAAYTHVFVANSNIRERSSTNDLLSGSYDNSLDLFSIGTRFQF